MLFIALISLSLFFFSPLLMPICIRIETNNYSMLLFHFNYNRTKIRFVWSVQNMQFHEVDFVTWVQRLSAECCGSYFIPNNTHPTIVITLKHISNALKKTLFSTMNKCERFIRHFFISFIHLFYSLTWPNMMIKFILMVSILLNYS